MVLVIIQQVQARLLAQPSRLILLILRLLRIRLILLEPVILLIHHAHLVSGGTQQEVVVLQLPLLAVPVITGTRQVLCANQILLPAIRHIHPVPPVSNGQWLMVVHQHLLILILQLLPVHQVNGGIMRQVLVRQPRLQTAHPTNIGMALLV